MRSIRFILFISCMIIRNGLSMLIRREENGCPVQGDIEIFCFSLYSPVSCGEKNCPYTNMCEARKAGWKTSGQCQDATSTASPSVDNNSRTTTTRPTVRTTTKIPIMQHAQSLTDQLQLLSKDDFLALKRHDEASSEFHDASDAHWMLQAVFEVGRAQETSQVYPWMLCIYPTSQLSGFFILRKLKTYLGQLQVTARRFSPGFFQTDLRCVLAMLDAHTLAMLSSKELERKGLKMVSLYPFSTSMKLEEDTLSFLSGWDRKSAVRYNVEPCAIGDRLSSHILDDIQDDPDTVSKSSYWTHLASSSPSTLLGSGKGNDNTAKSSILVRAVEWNSVLKDGIGASDHCQKMFSTEAMSVSEGNRLNGGYLTVTLKPTVRNSCAASLAVGLAMKSTVCSVTVSHA